MADLIALAEAKRHLKLSLPGIPEEDLDVQAKIEQATAIIIDYIQRPDDADWSDEIDSWDETSVPGPVSAAILIQLTELYRFRGDDVQADLVKREPGFLSPTIVALLHRYRRQVVA